MAYEKLPKPNLGFKIIPCKEKYVICHSKCEVASFKEGLHAEGQYVYKFEVELPEWLPTSFMLQSDTLTQ